MESSIAKRDKIGVQDFVLLEDYKSEAAFVENLRKRYYENLIYVSMDLFTRCIILVILDIYWKRTRVS